ncbi:MAG: IPTL-CTERM sorting domain-containing protein, partial [Acidobacteria bacterium]|nr:IPTL-CTERM sorting domain-containing protein [Acidobacteriota bacterium]
TTMLMAVEDSMAEDMEMLVLYGMEGNQRTENSLTFNIWDAAVPVLPLIAQLLLGSLLAVGGFRRYRRR